MNSSKPVGFIPPLDLDRKNITGTASGIAAEIEIDPIYIRVTFVLLTLAGGWGAFIYVLAWYLMSKVERKPKRVLTGISGDIKSQSSRLAGFTLVAGGLVIFSTQLSLGLRPEFFWPLSIGAVGYAILNENGAFSQDSLTSLSQRSSRRRMALAGFLMLAAIVSGLVLNFDLFQAMWGALVALLLISSLGLVFAPSIAQLFDDLSAERRRRIRIEEKAELAAHLHDSVLQTLTLIQKRSEEPPVVALARRQERELRSWLYGKYPSGVAGFKSGLINAMGEVEDIHAVAIEVVVVGDHLAKDSETAIKLEAVINAASQAATNSSVHSGASKIDVFAQASQDSVEVYVRDQGVGFDFETATSGRAGIRDSIIGRLKRHGGTAEIHTSPGAGTEVELRLDLVDNAETEQTENVVL